MLRGTKKPRLSKHVMLLTTVGNFEVRFMLQPRSVDIMHRQHASPCSKNLYNHVRSLPLPLPLPLPSPLGSLQQNATTPQIFPIYEILVKLLLYVIFNYENLKFHLDSPLIIRHPPHQLPPSMSLAPTSHAPHSSPGPTHPPKPQSKPPQPPIFT